jgi:Coenzyme PQQ synthesis protein D (PqqD)
MNPPLSASTIVVATSEQVSCAVGEESVILSFQNSVYYGVNPVGASIWKLLQRQRSVAELRDAVVEEYDVEKERCERDLLELLGKMQSEGLIEVVGSDATRAR